MEIKTTYRVKDTENGKYLSGKHPKFRFTSVGRIFVADKDIRRHVKMFVMNWRRVGQGAAPMQWVVERTIGDIVDTMPIEEFYDKKGFSNVQKQETK